MVLEAQSPPFNRLYKKLLKARLSHLYCGKSHMKCYKFYQQYKDHFATTRAKGPNCIFLQRFSSITISISTNNSISGSIRLKTQFPSTEKSLKLFFDKV